MEKKTIFKLAVAGVIAILVIVFGSGLIGGETTIEKAGETMKANYDKLRSQQ